MSCFTWVDIHKDLEELAHRRRVIPEEQKHPNDYFDVPNEYKGHICYKITELTEEYIDLQIKHLQELISW